MNLDLDLLSSLFTKSDSMFNQIICIFDFDPDPRFYSDLINAL